MSFIGEYLQSEGRDDLIEKYGLGCFSLNAISLERAFADKTFAVADYYLNGTMPYRQSRHIYDLHKLINLIRLDDDLAALFKVVREQRQGNLKCASAAPNVSLSTVLNEIFAKEVYRNDYEAVTMPLLYEDVDYDTAISAIPEIIKFIDEKQV
jgi:hypothetical protein